MSAIVSAPVLALKQFKFYFGVKFNDAKRMKALIVSNVINIFSITLSNTTNGFDNYEITINSKTKELAIQKIVIFLSENEFDARTIETFKTKASQPKVEKPKDKNVSSSSSTDEVLTTVDVSTADVSEKKQKVVKVKKVEQLISNSSTTSEVSEKKPKVMKQKKVNESSEIDNSNSSSNERFIELSFSVFTTSKDYEKVNSNLEELNFINTTTIGLFSNFKSIVKASSRTEAVEMVVLKLEKNGISTKTIENFKNKSSK
jgi:hypothetical protein